MVDWLRAKGIEIVLALLARGLHSGLFFRFDGKRHSNQVRQAPSLHFHHDAGTVYLDRSGADVQIGGDPPICTADHEVIKNIPLTRRQSLDSLCGLGRHNPAPLGPRANLLPHSNQVRQTPGLHFYHDAGAVYLDRSGADAELVGDGLVRTTDHEVLEHRPFARRQSLDSLHALSRHFLDEPSRIKRDRSAEHFPRGNDHLSAARKIRKYT